MLEGERGRPCPVCGQKLIPQYGPKEDFRMRTSLRPGRLYVPMRCPRCGINLEISIDEKDLLDTEDSGEQ